METLLNFIQKALSIQITAQMFHWRTNEFSRHQALGQFYDSFAGLVDKLVESYQGKYGKIKYEGGMVVEVMKFNKTDDFIDYCLTAINDMKTMVSDSNDSEILNVLDEIKTEIYRLKYLFTLK
jgi:hypothetical protein